MSDRRNVVPLHAPQPFVPWNISTWDGAPPKPPEWVVDGILLRGMVTLMTGMPGVGKSLALQQLLSAAALGERWLDKETIGVPTLGLLCEDPQDMIERRQMDINAHYGVSPQDYEGKCAIESRDGKDGIIWEVDRTDRGRPTALWDQIWDYVAAEGVGIVGFDTAAVVAELNENWRSHVTPFMRALTAKAVENNCAVILTQHPSKNSPNSWSGSGAWLGSARFGLNMGRPKEYDPETGKPALERVLRGLKANYSAGIQAEKLLWDRGVFIRDRSDEITGGAAPVERLSRMELEYRMLSSAKKLIQSYGVLIAADPTSSSGIAERVRRSPDPAINKIPYNTLYQVQDELVRSGHLVVVRGARGRILIRPADCDPYPDEQPLEYVH